jgi:hypothetical protein
MKRYTRMDEMLAALRKGPATVAQLCHETGVIDPHNVIYILRYRGYDIRTRRTKGKRCATYVLRED